MHEATRRRFREHVMLSQLSRRIAARLNLNHRTNFKSVSVDEIARVSNELEDSWQDAGIPDLQWGVVAPQIERFREGSITPEFQALIYLFQNLKEDENLNCLELGCSSGYYSEILLKYFPKIEYQGCDYSPSFIAKARELYPLIDFSVEDTTSLSFPNQSFYVTISGSVLLHVPDWKKGLAETARITKRYMILHRTPVYLGPTKLFTKLAYGREVIEWSFSREEIIALSLEMGFQLVKEINVYEKTKLSKDTKSTIQQSYLFERTAK